jgi:hypothetical protein
MNRTLMLLLVLLSGASSYLDGQSRSSGSSGRDPGPVATLIGLRQELSLTDAQIAQLEIIDARMEQQNRPFVTRMSELRRRLRSLGDRDTMTPQERELRDRYMEEARPLMRSIEQNNRTAMEQVGEVLTEPQKVEIRRRIKERVENERERSSSSTQRFNRN